jgi:uncharacterized protein
MQCPVDGTTLVMSDRQGIEIDYCPQCRGVWLDRGEIDKIVERSMGQGAPQQAPMQQSDNRHQPQQQQYRDHDDDDDYNKHGGNHNQKHHKKESWFGELFE